MALAAELGAVALTTDREWARGDVGVSVEVIEKEELNGQILQGVGTSREVNSLLKARGLEHEFPLLTATYRMSLPSLRYQGKDGADVAYRDTTRRGQTAGSP